MPSLRLVHALALVVAVLTLTRWAESSRAQVIFDPFTIEGVEVDVTAANAQLAKDQAITTAQRQAFASLLDRLTGPEDRARLPKADGVDYVRDFTVLQEHNTANRYIASFAVRFNHAAVKKLLEGAGIAVAEGRSRPVVVAPVFTGDDGRATLWDDPNPWRGAWSELKGGGLVPMILPLGDLGDMQAMTVEQALAGDGLAMQALGARWRSPDVLVAAASLHGKVLDVALHAAPTTPKPSDSLRYQQKDGETVEALLARAAKDISRAIDTAYRQGAISTGEAGTVSALVPLDNFSQWLAVRDRLGRVQLVQRWELVSLSRVEAAVVLHVKGNTTQVGDALAKGGLTLAWNDGFWTIRPVGVN